MVPTFESPAAPSPVQSPPPDTPHPRGARIAFILVVTGLVAVIGFVTWQGTLRAGGDHGATPGSAGEEGTITLAVDGMSCVGCASAVETSLEEVPGVAEVTVDYEHRLARIRLADENVAPATLVKAIEEAGYKARVER